MLGPAPRRKIHISRRRTGAFAATAAATLLLASCSSSATSGRGAPDVAPSGPASSGGAAAPSSEVSQRVTTPPAPSAPSLPASSEPADGGLTPTGTTVKVGTVARVPYETDTLSKESSVLAISVVSVRPGSIADLKGFDLDAQTKNGVPFYVTARFADVGGKAVKPSGIFGVINAYNGAGDKLSELDLIGDFPRCDGLPPQSLAPGHDFTMCQVYVAPAGQHVQQVVFDHFVKDTETKVTWRV